MINRRKFLKGIPTQMVFALSVGGGGWQSRGADSEVAVSLNAADRKDWLAQWEREFSARLVARPCDKEMGEELGWLVSPFLNGFYYGYLATRDSKWVVLLTDWMDACVKRAVKEPDGYLGWPKGDGGGGEIQGVFRR